MRILTRSAVGRLLTAAVAGLVAACGAESHPTAGPRLLGARSAAPKVTLTVGGAGSTAGGTVTSNRGGLTCTITYAGGKVGKTGACERQYKTGTTVTLTAASSGGSVVAGWTGCTDAAESHQSCAVTLDVARSVDVVYEPPPSRSRSRSSAAPAAAARRRRRRRG